MSAPAARAAKIAVSRNLKKVNENHAKISSDKIGWKMR